MGFQLVRRPLDWELSAADVLRMVRADPHPVALLGAWAGGSDIVASDPVRVCCPPGPLGDVLDAPGPARLRPAGAGAAFGGGWIGYLGFALAGQFLPVPPPPGEPRQLPAYWFAYYDHVLRRDRATGRWVVRGAVGARPRPARWSAGSGSCRAARTPPPGVPRAAIRRPLPADPVGRRSTAPRSGRRSATSAAATSSRPTSACGSRRRSPGTRWTRSAARSPGWTRRTPRSCGRRTGPWRACHRSCSCAARAARVWSRPIKGTRSRPAGELLARQQRERLERSAKDQAENVMIVDLMRNDLSRVCVPGSVRVPALLRAEASPRRVAPGLRRARHADGRDRRRAADRGHVPAGVGHRRPEGPGAGDHPRAGGHAQGGVHRGRRLPQSRGRAWS